MLSPIGFPGDEELAALATRRPFSLFADDLAAHWRECQAAVEGRRILVIGGAGSIGSSTTALLLGLRPKALHVVDLDENRLAELVRDIRSREEMLIPDEFRLVPVDYGGIAMERLLGGEKPYDVVLHFAASKHVRSEKDLPSLVQMIDTNVVKFRRLLSLLDQHCHHGRLFTVSTDKAARPTSAMGATKRLMEHVLFSASGSLAARTTARFANVAFSNGSLLQAFLFRLARRQPLAVPRGVKRFFVSRQEAGEICLLAATATPSGHIVFPRLDPEMGLRPLTEIAEAVLQRMNLDAAFYEDEVEARAAVAGDLGRGRYPVLVTTLDTSGEKPFEEFLGPGETAEDVGFSAMQAIRYHGSPPLLAETLRFLEALVGDAGLQVTKTTVIERLAAVVEGFAHVEAGRSLDERP
jgi:FlaA1/EpsC-like NDP-sugar epimerase